MVLQCGWRYYTCWLTGTSNILSRTYYIVQSTNNILLIRPAAFGFNSHTSASNSFQQKLNEKEDVIKQNAVEELDAFAAALIAKGVNVFVIDDTTLPAKPDAIFPNNWVTFHAGGTVILYPMFAHNRRHERRQDILDLLKKDFEIMNVIDLSGYENEDKFLEGTGSIVFDHVNKVAYASLSPRTDRSLFLKVCGHLGYKPVCFHSHDANGKEIYHTNVMMCIAEEFAVICIDSITDREERTMVDDLLTASSFAFNV